MSTETKQIWVKRYHPGCGTWKTDITVTSHGDWCKDPKKHAEFLWGAPVEFIERAAYEAIREELRECKKALHVSFQDIIGLHAEYCSAKYTAMRLLKKYES